MALDFDLVGDGPEHVVAMHDWTTDRRTWQALHPLLDTDAFSYAFMDHRGYGGSRGVPGVHTAQEAAGDVVAVADELGWDSFHVVGHSMSGMIAQRVTLDVTERVRSLVAVTPVPTSGVPADADGLALFRASATDGTSFKQVARLLTGDRLTERWYDQRLAAFRDGIDPDAYLEFLTMWTQAPFDADMRELDIPALVVVGEHDFEVFSEPMLRESIGPFYPQAQFAVLAGSGHFPMAEVPVYFVTVVEQFLRQVARGETLAT